MVLRTETKVQANVWDRVANKGTYYVQVSWQIDTPKKKGQEYQSIRNIPDSFKKVILVKKEENPYFTEDGFLRIGLPNFP